MTERCGQDDTSGCYQFELEPKFPDSVLLSKVLVGHVRDMAQNN